MLAGAPERISEDKHVVAALSGALVRLPDACFDVQESAEPSRFVCCVTTASRN